MPNSLDPDQARRFVGPDLGPKGFQRLSVDDKRVNRMCRFLGMAFTFSSYDLCALLSQFEGPNGTSICPQQLKDNNFPCHCPFQAGHYHLNPVQFMIPELSGVWQWLASVSIVRGLDSLACHFYFGDNFL